MAEFLAVATGIHTLKQFWAYGTVLSNCSGPMEQFFQTVL
jgi:hypothetical protein